jgi:hypothetical protein
LARATTACVSHRTRPRPGRWAVSRLDPSSNRGHIDSRRNRRMRNARRTSVRRMRLSRV